MRKVSPIPMSNPMVVAILEDKKTQTRRTVKNPEYYGCLTGDCPHQKQSECTAAMIAACPYGKPGDLLYVREAWTTLSLFDSLSPRHIDRRARIEYLASGKRASGRYRHARFMCRWMSRITLELTDVRVQRLKDISHADCIAEGCDMKTGHPVSDEIDSCVLYQVLWESINGAGSWDENPWVWVLGFKVHKMNIDQFLKQREATR